MSTEGWAVCGVLALSTLFVYAQVRSHSFVSYDDPLYIQNPAVMRGLSLQSLWWALTSGLTPYWHPLTWLTHMLDYQLWGANAGAHLFVNALMHAASAVLLFAVLQRMSGALWPSAFVAAVFALHPLRVESVAWVAERKDVLSTLFWVLTMWAYALYAERPTWRRYAVLAVTYALGLMAKPMLVTLPLALLLLDVWPLRRVRLEAGQRDVALRLFLEKVPLLGLAAISSAITIVNQRAAGALSPVEFLSLGQRVSNALVSYVSYLGMLVWPVDLAVLYPHRVTLPVWEIGAAVAVLLLVSALALWMSRRFPYVLVGWLWYVGTLVPVIGLMQAGEQALADRFTYVPMIGILMIIAWGVPDLLAQWKQRQTALAAAACAAVIACTALSWVQLQYWKDSETLYRRALAVTTRNAAMYNNLGLLMMERGNLPEAETQFRSALEVRPTHAKAHTNLALILSRKGDAAGAAQHSRQAVQLAPLLPEVRSNLGQVLQSQGDLTGAEAEYREALRLSPNNGELQYNLGVLFMAQRRFDDAIGAFQQALRLAPNLVEARNNLAAALTQAGRLQEARAQFEEVVRVRPTYAEAHYNLALLLLRLGEVQPAVSHLQTAVRLRPDLTQARAKLAELTAVPGGPAT